MECRCESTNIYLPRRMKISGVVCENPEGDLKTFTLSFFSDENETAFSYMPGQFAEVSVFGAGEAPFGIASSPTEKGIVRFSVKRVGEVTTALHMMEEGDVVGLRGPLGNSWPLDRFAGRNLVVIGGGFAFTTLRSLVAYIIDEKHRQYYGDVTVVYGARDPGQILYRDELKEWSGRSDLNMHLTIDRPFEGWWGNVGFVPAVTEEVVATSSNTLAVVCGPPVMIRFTLPVLKKIGFTPENIYTSMEMKMKCGIGMCGRCNIGGKYVCRDGPVFSMAELEKMAPEY